MARWHEVPKSEEKYGIDHTPPKKGWMDPSVEFRKGTFCYSCNAQSRGSARASQSAGMGSGGKRLETSSGLERNDPEGDEGPPGTVSFGPSLSGYLRPVRSLRGQVPLFHRFRRSQEYACPSNRTFAVGLSEILHPFGKGAGKACRGKGIDRGGSQGVVLLFLSMHRMPSVFRLLPLRDRHG